ncbi:MAG: hypothetical protein A3G75_00450 [Verrucomicrobia bacterium RIFCSPLOWO2_12_FULL_64_8]|nr:MAG: hypothetical protein A3G75_00450 [Verrucomicrobia bacterium RIFCSPLOWO2_12_FULL_64_8]
MPTLLDDRTKSVPPRYWVPGLSQDPETRSVQIGFFWTLLVHLLLLLLAPVIFREEFAPGLLVKSGTSAKNFDIEIMPEPPAPAPPSQFVETNPDAPDNEPDKTDNFGAQNQQSAQPVPDKDSTLRTPRTEGPDNIKNATQFVTGELHEPILSQPVPPAPEQPVDETKPAETPRAQQVPLPGYLKSEGESKETFGTSAVKLPEPSNAAPEQVEGDPNVRDPDGTGRNASVGMRPQPLPRPRVTPVRPGILQNRPVGVSNAGHIGVDARFSEFGDYLQELVETVQVQWDTILTQSRFYPHLATHVAVTFRLTAKGEVTEIVKVEGDAGEYGTRACLSAIQARAPYRPWTRQMVAILGEDQVLTFTFHYW